jgi:hypothetical protein
MDHRYDHQCQCSKCSNHERKIKVAMLEEQKRDRAYLAKRMATNLKRAA